MKRPTEPYRGTCEGCRRPEWLDVGHLCAYCFAMMEPEAQSVHMAHIRWVNNGRPADTDDPWE